jgi:hypothetical protein
MTTSYAEKIPMSTGYKIIFCLAILVLLGNLSTMLISIGAKAHSSFLPIFLWIYVI